VDCTYKKNKFLQFPTISLRDFQVYRLDWQRYREPADSELFCCHLGRGFREGSPGISFLDWDSSLESWHLSRVQRSPPAIKKKAFQGDEETVGWPRVWIAFQSEKEKAG